MRLDKDTPRHIDVGLGQDVVIVGMASMELAVDLLVVEEHGSGLTGAEEMVVCRTGACTTTNGRSYLLTAITTLRGEGRGEREREDREKTADAILQSLHRRWYQITWHMRTYMYVFISPWLMPQISPYLYIQASHYIHVEIYTRAALWLKFNIKEKRWFLKPCQT